MQKHSIKNSLFLNILSALGYINLIIFLVWVFYFYPNMLKFDNSTDMGFAYFAIVGTYTIRYYFLQIIISVLLIILSRYENKIPLLKNKEFKPPQIARNFHSYLFWTGIILTFLPTAILILFLVLSNIFSFITDNF